MSTRTLCILRNLPMFTAASAKCCDALVEAAHVQALEKGSTLFLQGERASSVQFVVDGWVKLYRMAPYGGEAIIRLQSRGRSLDEVAVLKGAPHGVSAETVTDSTVLSIDATAFRRIAATQACLSAALLQAVMDHADALTDDLEQMKVRNSVQRVALFLLALAETHGGSAQLRLPYEKHLIAGSLGMKPESFSRALGRLRARGVKVQDSEVRIADLGALRAFAQSDPALSWA